MDFEHDQFGNHPLNEIDSYEGDKPLYVELPSQEQLGIMKVASEIFQLPLDYGTKELRDKHRINNKIRKYFIKRFFLFSKFDDGIQLDEESWYSVVGEPISLWLKNRLLNSKIHLNTVFEPFVGVGGIAVHLSCIAHRYIVNDLDPAKIEMLRNNLSVYGVDQTNIDFNQQDFLEVVPFKSDLIVLCPPWGGTNLEMYATKDLDEIMVPKLSDILKHACEFSHNMIIQMPKNTNIQNLMKVISRAYGTPVAQIVKIMFNKVVSQLFIFIGDEAFTQILRSDVYGMLYDTFKCESKETRDKLKKEYRSNPSDVLRQAYTVTHPTNKKQAKRPTTPKQHRLPF